MPESKKHESTKPGHTGTEGSTEMNCKDMNSKMADLLLDPEQGDGEGNSEAASHLAECNNCRTQLDELRATMALLDAWEVPEPNPYFLTRFNARLEEERQAVPASWFERMRARFAYGSRMSLRPVAAMAMTVTLLLGGGAYLGFTDWTQPPPPPAQAAVVNDLQTLDSNAQLLDQLESISDQND
ncbi:anti-sigma factor family protein [Acidicapsa ligni]|uniref:anti-sigma factor family protein n=1 Tax=Acidicapsa ligni TaxID=542300 RepID=UPI0021DFB89C|nr:hypothetical protein [Acidicapsa ligni]